MTTWSSAAVSSPRAAASVHTSTSASPDLNRAYSCLRFSGGMPPCVDATRWPPRSSRKCAVDRQLAMLLQNTITRPRRPASASSSASCLSEGPPPTGTNTSRRPRGVVCKSPPSMTIARGKRRCTTRCAFRPVVAPASTYCGGVASSTPPPPSRSPCCRSSRSRSGVNPDAGANIVSASSTTTYRRSDRNMSPSSRADAARPGVATTRSTNESSAFLCRPLDTPPDSSMDRNLAVCASDLATPSTCCASSREGTTTIARGRRRRAVTPSSVSSRLSACTTGSRYASVLPVPVCAVKMQSSPASTRGMTLR
mmetsp:Transcript_26433/g.91939  ORF Transcript_26433/g.91939 Transcript_26433/m.91939 type:complete len:310 (+) Transcript_26433:308-1237(+)